MYRFSIHEIAILPAQNHINEKSNLQGTTVECEIIAQPGHSFNFPSYCYVVKIPDNPSSDPTGYWACVEESLHKRKPPYQDCDETRAKGAPTMDDIFKMFETPRVFTEEQSS